jgi:hypothetical protein
MEKKVIKYVYPYVWLDEAVEITLNPQKSNVIELQTEQLETIKSKFNQELQEVLKDLKANAFFLVSFDEIKAMVSQYYNSLLSLEQQATHNLAGYPDGHPLVSTGENILLYIRDTLRYFKVRYGNYIGVNDVKASTSLNIKPIVQLKLLCNLSGDQIGIILKAADDTRLIGAKSLSLVFQSIVPYLSTYANKDLSWDSIRKSTYRMEQVDKDIAIAALEKLIRKIKDY